MINQNQPKMRNIKNYQLRKPINLPQMKSTTNNPENPQNVTLSYSKVIYKRNKPEFHIDNEDKIFIKDKIEEKRLKNLEKKNPQKYL